MSSTRMRRVIGLACLGALLSASIVVAQDGAAGREETAPVSEGESETSGAEGTAAESREVTEDGGKVKVFRFSGLDISGRLKTPQLLYFLNRLRTEFDRPRLPHRSFVPELVRSAKDESL